MLAVTKIDCLRECNSFKSITIKYETSRVVSNIWNDNYRKIGSGEYYISDFIVHVLDTTDNTVEKISLEDFSKLVWNSYYRDLGIIEKFAGLNTYDLYDANFERRYNKNRLLSFSIIILSAEELRNLLKLKISQGNVDLQEMTVTNLGDFLNKSNGVVKIPEGYKRLVVYNTSPSDGSIVKSIILPDSMIYASFYGDNLPALRTIHVKNLFVFRGRISFSHKNPVTIYCREDCSVLKSFFCAYVNFDYITEEQISAICDIKIITPSITAWFDWNTKKVIRKKNFMQ